MQGSSDNKKHWDFPRLVYNEAFDTSWALLEAIIQLYIDAADYWLAPQKKPIIPLVLAQQTIYLIYHSFMFRAGEKNDFEKESDTCLGINGVLGGWVFQESVAVTG